ncbi:hypothetical protein [Azospirillum brasilense]|uniref:Uncharacterized protein n=1 Tax=Azospirillum brasilense TaxID=192 RepID=A0A6L3AZS0_AZOBR|nr:hypothetical protein [Azospirillum brasilense]KAA0684859.1 hypothetical protein DS837_15320 [Azospirillum brasilense]
MSVAMMPLPEWSPLPFDPAMAPAERCRCLVAAFPDALREVLATGTLEHRPRFGENGFEGLQESWSPPASLSARQVAMAQRVLRDLESSILAPAEPDHLLGRVLALLSHFPAKGLTPDVEQLVAMDWVEDLGEFPAWAIDDAARAWRRTRKWRPSIAEMRALCEEACAKERVLAQRLRRIVQTLRASNAGHGLAEIRRFP